MKFVFNKFKNMDSSISKVLFDGLKFCFILVLLSALMLSVYHSIHNIDLFYIGISIFKSSLFFIAFFAICAIAVDTIRKDIPHR